MFDELIKKNKSISTHDLDKIVELLKTDKEKLKAFEQSYKAFESTYDADNLATQNAKREIDSVDKLKQPSVDVEELIDNIVNELLSQTKIWSTEQSTFELLPVSQSVTIVKPQDFDYLPKDMRPIATGHYMKRDIEEPSYTAVLDYYQKWLETGDIHMYQQFHHGLDVLDLDPIMYELLNCDPASMGNWLPQINKVVGLTAFKIPKTKIMKVPMNLLQTTRVVEYQELSPIMIEIINRFVMKAFDLNVEKDYFIKTGTFSSKFDFRNAKVTKGQEVMESGSYLWYITSQAIQMCSILNNRPIYGISTNNEWVVREFIDDVEDNTTIYHGLPLRTEYRVFVDFDTKEVLGISPYWREDIVKHHMQQRLSENPDMLHDFVTYSANQERLEGRYHENKSFVMDNVEKLLKDCTLKGQWSIDIMQNGSDFWLIDMAPAHLSALNDVVPKDKLKRQQVDYLTALQLKLGGWK